MTLRVAINGLGRIGRNLMRAYFEDAILAGSKSPEAYAKKQRAFDIVAINDIGSAEALVHLLRYDTTHGRFSGEVVLEEHEGEHIIRMNGQPIAVSHEAEPARCPWQRHQVDVVLECTGVFRARADAAQHIKAGARQVIIGAVGFDEVDNTIVYGVNHEQYGDEQTVISSASCTTHCLAPLLQVIDQQWGVEAVLMTEIHAYTSDQSLLDRVHRDLHRARAGAQNLIPTTSSSINAVQQVLPQMQGKIDGYSMRVPTINVAAVDLTLQLGRSCGVAELHEVMQQQARHLSGLLGYNDEPLVSSDFIGRSESAIFDATQTKRVGGLLKCTAWYDNEWGYTHRLMDLLDYISSR